MERTVHVGFEDGVWYIDSFDGLLMADTYDELLIRAQEKYGPDVQLIDLETADAARTLGL